MEIKVPEPGPKCQLKDPGKEVVAAIVLTIQVSRLLRIILFESTFVWTKFDKVCIFLDEPVYNSANYRRKSVFAEAYNPEEDDGDDTKVVRLIIDH